MTATDDLGNTETAEMTIQVSTAGICAEIADGTPCSDDDICNGVEECLGGECLKATPTVDCNDQNECTLDTCDALAGCAHVPLDGTSCADGDPCNGAEICGNGTCLAGTPLACDDGDLCTADTCDVVAGCVHDATCGYVPIASDDFESGNFSGGTGWSGPWTVASPAATTTRDGPHGGSRHAKIGMSTGALTRIVDTSGISSLQLSFWAKVQSYEASDTSVIEISSDGSSFVPLHTFTSADSDSSYHIQSLDLTAFASPTLTLRIRSAAGSGDILFIDDVLLEGF
jgi:hypothetical protein